MNRIKRLIQFNYPLQYIFLVLGAIEGLLFSFVIPLNQIPDELHHYYIIEREMGIDGYAKDIEEYFLKDGMKDVIGDYYQKVDSSKYFDFESKFHKRLSLSEIKLNKLSVRHFPSIIGLSIGMLLNFPIIICTGLAEFFSVLFYVIIGFLCIKIAPIKKDMFLFILLMPMTVQQCASINYDAIVICCSLLFTAFALYLIYMCNEVGWRHLLLAFILLLLIGLTKPPYCLLVFLLLFIPLEKYKFKFGKNKTIRVSKKTFYILLGVIALISLCAVYLLRNTYMVKLILAVAFNPLEFLRLFYNSWADLNDFYIRSFVGNFGALDSAVSALFIVVFFVFLVYMNSHRDDEYVIRKKHRILFLLIGIMIVFMIYIPLLDWTYQIKELPTETTVEVLMENNKALWNIEGIQGRYFIPVLPLFLLPFSGEKKKTKTYKVFMSIYYIGSFLYVISVLLRRYWF